jgi:hypothetical protein
MSETPELDTQHSAQKRDDLMASRLVRRETVIDAIGRFRSTVLDARKMRIEARLQLARDLGAARIGFRRAVVRNAARMLANG